MRASIEEKAENGRKHVRAHVRGQKHRRHLEGAENAPGARKRGRVIPRPHRARKNGPEGRKSRQSVRTATAPTGAAPENQSRKRTDSRARRVDHTYRRGQPCAARAPDRTERARRVDHPRTLRAPGVDNPATTNTAQQEEARTAEQPSLWLASAPMRLARQACGPRASPTRCCGKPRRAAATPRWRFGRARRHRSRCSTLRYPPLSAWPAARPKPWR